MSGITKRVPAQRVPPVQRGLRASEGQSAQPVLPALPAQRVPQVQPAPKANRVPMASPVPWVRLAPRAQPGPHQRMQIRTELPQQGVERGPVSGNGFFEAPSAQVHNRLWVSHLTNCSSRSNRAA